MQECDASKVYQPLQKNEIRLLQLDSPQTLAFSLVTVGIGDLSKYIALSYTWGSQMLSEIISLDGHAFAITTNLRDALENLAWRVKEAGCYFWINAICINQQDAAERSSQVQVMGKIYQNSHCVFVWLGLPKDERDAIIAMEKIRSVGNAYRETERVGARARILNSTYRSLLFDSLGSDTMRAWDAFENLFHLNWWTRAWIIQEGSCPRPVIIYYGTACAELSEFVSCVWATGWMDREFSELGRATRNGIDGCVRLGEIYHSRKHHNLPCLELGHLVWHSRPTQCHDGRDKIYSVMSFASDIPDWLVADYSEPVVEVYIGLCQIFNGSKP
jgi:hypothetical protein